MNVAWLSYLDSSSFHGGGELNQRELIAAGRRRGHRISESAFMRSRPQRALRRSHLHRGIKVDWDADVFVLANIRNCPQIASRFPEAVVRHALETGRAAVLQEGWVDVCTLDMPCGGDRDACSPACNRVWANRLYSSAAAAFFNSPMQRDMIAAVLDVPLPAAQILSRPMVDVDAFRPRGVERDIDVLYVGTIKAAKGYYTLLERFGPARLTFVGPNALGHDVEGKYLGPVPHEQLPAIYNRARTFAHLPEWYEPMGRTVVEATLCGCQVITNERVGVTSYPASDWSDPEVVLTNADRFWEEFEELFIR